MARILLLHTGGTIGMGPGPGGYAPLPDFLPMLEQCLARSPVVLPDYVLQQYEVPIDSSNATPADWQRIARDVIASYPLFDGFVILHGTDTMAYSASALSFMLRGLRKPVVLTGAQIPLVEPESDGPVNLRRSMLLAARTDLAEVVISFGDVLLRGNRSTKVSAVAGRAFDSPNYPALGAWGSELVLRATQPAARGPEDFQVPQTFPARIFSLRFTPGLPLVVLSSLLALQPQALILECYGAGNVPDQDPALFRLLSAASAAGVVVVARSQCLHGPARLGSYATSALLLQAGVVGAEDMTFEALYCKLHYLFAQGLDGVAVRAALKENMCGEISASTAPP